MHAPAGLSYSPFPIEQVRPEGWLLNQLRIQAAGLAGHLDEFHPHVKDSGWFGGEGFAWDRGPYWLDGMVSLAYLLKSDELISKADRHVDYLIKTQHEDGWLGPKITRYQSQSFPETYPTANCDLLPQMLVLKCLVGYSRASGDERVVDVVEKSLRNIDRHIDQPSLFDWAMFRWFDTLIPIIWLHDQTGEQWLIDLAVKLHAQGFNWGAFFEKWPLTEPSPRGRWSQMSHVVNNAMAIRAHGLWWRLSGDDRDRAAVYDMIEKLDRYHGMATGIFTGDECLAGKDPIHGTELCAVVEYMHSLEILFSVFGDPAFGDRLEKIAYNALPAALSYDMWANQYDQQANQIQCSFDNDVWTTNGPDANGLGLTHCSCCATNFGQGWPRLAEHVWMRPADEEGLAVFAYAPCAVNAEISGAPVCARLKTDYPFRGTATLEVTAEEAVAFPLLLRIPGWAKGATVAVGEEAPRNAEPNTMFRIEREWQGKTVLQLDFPMTATAERRYRNSLSIQRGPLVYSLKIGEDWRQVPEGAEGHSPHAQPPHADWEVYATTPWNYALDVDESTVAKEITFAERPVGDCPFSPDGAPVIAKAKGKRLPEWQKNKACTGELPESPVTSDEAVEELTLVPYGCTTLKITEFPTLKRESGHARNNEEE